MHVKARHPKLNYFLTSASKWLAGQGFACPACGSREGVTLSRKYGVTLLRQCAGCSLRYRAPTTTAEEAAAFYQTEYTQGWQSSQPTDEEIANLTKTEFKNTPVDFSTYIRLLQSLGVKPGETIYDFGCSWGYGSWQFEKAGFRVTAFEISVPRCKIAREKLGINASTEHAKGQFDVFFAAHVVEHVPSPTEVIKHALENVKPGGLIVLLTPNGSDTYRKTNPKGWNYMWGGVHPQFLDEKYYGKQFAGMKHLFASEPYDFDAVAAWARNPTEERTLALTGYELLVAVRKPL